MLQPERTPPGRGFPLGLSPPLWRILITNVAPSFVGSALALYITELREARRLSMTDVSVVMSAIAAAIFVGPMTGGLLSRVLRAHAIVALAAALFTASLSTLAFTITTSVAYPSRLRIS